MEGATALGAVFDKVQPPTTFEETVERLGTAIRLGLLPPGTRLPPERELAEQLGISRSTLRQALTTLVQSGHLISLRGRSGGTFVSEEPPISSGRKKLRADWHDVLDQRVAIECGAALLAALMTEVQGQMSELISLIAHPEIVLEHANQEHRRIVKCLRGGDGVGAIRVLRDHLAGTEHIIAGLIPQDAERN